LIYLRVIKIFYDGNLGELANHIFTNSIVGTLLPR
jgi:hypothetical protein